MRAVAPALLDHIGVMPYTAVDAIHADPDQAVPFCQRGSLLLEPTHETVDALLAAAGPRVHSPDGLRTAPYGRHTAPGPADGNAVSERIAAYSLSVIGLMAPDTTQTDPAAVDAVINAAEPWSTGATLVNLHGRPGDDAYRARTWDAPTYRRLVMERHVAPGRGPAASLSGGVRRALRAHHRRAGRLPSHRQGRCRRQVSIVRDHVIASRSFDSIADLDGAFAPVQQ